MLPKCLNNIMELLQIVYFLKIIPIPHLIVHRNRVSNRKSIVVQINVNNNKDKNRKIVVIMYAMKAVSINKI
jgi:hypothetical protein